MGRVLRFTASALLGAPLNQEQALGIAVDFVSGSDEGRSPEIWAHLSNPDVIVYVLNLLREKTSQTPSQVGADAASLYEHIKKSSRVGFFDEKDYFLGESALLAGGASRVTGELAEAENWFDLAELSFQHTVNPAAQLIRVSHARLALRYDMKRYREVLKLLPALKAEYLRLGMETDHSKARFLEAITLKELGESDGALSVFLELKSVFGTEPRFRSLVLANIAEEYSRRDDHESALPAYEEALQLATETEDVLASVHLKSAIAESHRARGEFHLAVEFLRAATSDAAASGMQTRLAYLRVILAESLLASGRDREAEWEILAALPVIEEQRLVVEGYTAIAILRESVARRRMDPVALRTLRQKLQAS